MINRRKHQRLLIHQPAKSGVLKGNFVDSDPRFNFKPIILDISFGGLNLIFLPPLSQKNLQGLLSGKKNLLLEFRLPPSLRTLTVTGKIKWAVPQTIEHTKFSILGIEFLTKTQELYREIDNFIKTPSIYSEFYKNKRLFPRIPSHMKAEFSISGIKKFKILPKTFEGTITNISALGVMMYVTPSLKPKELEFLNSRYRIFKLKFQLPSFKKLFIVQSRIAHIKSMKKTKNSESHTLIGLKFIELTYQEKKLLIQYVCINRFEFLKNEISLTEQQEQAEKDIIQ